MEQFNDIFEDGYIEPKAEEKAALIARLQAGDFTLSFSSLTAFAVSPAAFIAYKLQETKTTDAMLLGELVHCMVLEPEKMKERFHIAPDVNAATTEGKQAWASLYMDFTGITLPHNKSGNYIIPKVADIITEIRNVQGVTVVPFKIADAAQFRARKLTTNRACRSILDEITYTEKKIEFEFCGLNFRGVIDGGGAGLIVDLKNMPDATLERATSAIWGRRLHWQAFGYDKSLGGGNTCYILAVDGSGETSVHAFNSRHLDNAHRQMTRYCYYFKQCITESLFDAQIWDSSQDFWLRSNLNINGINYL